MEPIGAQANSSEVETLLLLAPAASIPHFNAKDFIMAIRPITDTLRLLQGGLFIEECSDKLAEAVKAVDETGKAGKLTITLDLKKSGGALAISAKVTNKAPEAKPDEDLLWPTVEGNLSLDNPNQRKLDLQVAPGRPAEIRDVDQATGEITIKSA